MSEQNLTEIELIKKIRQSQNDKSFVETRLETDERVIARVTDGIYRQPASALRELISNAYDADSTRVVIKTDAPRFERIVVEDDGSGMTPEVLAHLLHHIGGSAKRNEEGKDLGITDTSDPTLSPGGRKLIGKIGIGLFSVSQLTHSFQIISKVANDKYRTIATVTLRQYSDDPSVSEAEKNDKFEAGKVNIWRERAVDVDSHGTTIVLNHIRPQARDTLRSREIWGLIEESEKADPTDEKQDIDPPKYHIGRVDPQSGDLLKRSSGNFASLPWNEGASPDEAFRDLVDSVWNEIAEGYNPNPRLDRLFDYYLRMIWQLALAIPLPYVNGNPFDLPLSTFGHSFLLANQGKSSAALVDAAPADTLRAALNLTVESQASSFDVFIDNLKLYRPLRFVDLPMTSHALKAPLFFAGKCIQEFEKSPVELSGGPLEFEAYLFWAPKIAPVEHQGSLIRINGSSGTLFDPTFMRYQVSEQTRLRQITCEIFVKRGLDSALNIDRESFNNAHPHTVFITKWLHNALRQVASAQKKIASEVREQERTETQAVAVSGLQSIARRVWEEQSGDELSRPPAIEFYSAAKAEPGEEGDAYIFTRSSVFGNEGSARTSAARARQAILEEKLKAIIQTLASFELLDQLPKRKQERLIRGIYDILKAEDQ